MWEHWSFCIDDNKWLASFIFVVTKSQFSCENIVDHSLGKESDSGDRRRTTIKDYGFLWMQRVKITDISRQSWAGKGVKILNIDSQLIGSFEFCKSYKAIRRPMAENLSLVGRKTSTLNWRVCELSRVCPSHFLVVWLSLVYFLIRLLFLSQTMSQPKSAVNMSGWRDRNIFPYLQNYSLSCKEIMIKVMLLRQTGVVGTQPD